jgi:hypothetical protein
MPSAPALTGSEQQMPRYFFHVKDGFSTKDTEGSELPDIYMAQEEAIRLSGELLREMGENSGTAQSGV